MVVGGSRVLSGLICSQSFFQLRPLSSVNQTPLSVTIQPMESLRKKIERGYSFKGCSAQCWPPSAVDTDVYFS